MAAPPSSPSNFTLHLGLQPSDTDVAIASTGSRGSQGYLSDLALDQYGYTQKDLDGLNIESGRAVLQKAKKRPILFIVSVGDISTSENIFYNLAGGIRTNLPVFSDRSVWVPLMGTGAGGLSFQESYDVITEVLDSFEKERQQHNIQFMVSVPKDKEGKTFFNNVQFDIPEKNPTKQAHIDFDPPSDLSKKSKQSSSAHKGDAGPPPEISEESTFVAKTTFLLSTLQDNTDYTQYFIEKGIWELQSQQVHHQNVLNAIDVGSRTYLYRYAMENKEHSVIIQAYGIVTNNEKNTRIIEIDWYSKHEGLPIPFRDISEFPVLAANNEEDAQLAATHKTEGWEQLAPPTNASTNTQALAGLLSDSDMKSDYLDISKDVSAFARVIASKSFKPPLAFGLFGRWGSGKSFFMGKLQESITRLSEINPEEAFCEGIAHVHFNAWSYMDSNLWASIVSRIFEGLQRYITEDADEPEIKKEIEKTLTQSLSITQQELMELKKEQETIEGQLEQLETKRDDLQEKLDETHEKLRHETLDTFLEKMEEEFNVSQEVSEAIEENKSFIKSKENFRNIIPDTYWNNPVDLYERVQSRQTFLRSFFLPNKLTGNIIWLVIILALVIGVPLLIEVLNVKLEKLNFKFPTEVWALISVLGGLYVKGIKTYNKLQPMVASFWRIKEDYNNKKQEAISNFEEQQRAYHTQIEAYKSQMTAIKQRIQNTKEQQKDLEFRLKNTLSTEALYSFIERRSESKDYKKHLGIISTIRKDFEILSKLFTGHHDELDKSGDSSTFIAHFNRPLERIVLYIDDLDRCPEERVVEVLEAVNLLMAFSLFIVVVGVDPRWVKNALIQKHKMQFGTTDKDLGYEMIEPSSYLEKIFQVPFNLRAASDASVKTMLRSLVSDANTTAVTDARVPDGKKPTPGGAVAPDLKAKPSVEEKPTDAKKKMPSKGDKTSEVHIEKAEVSQVSIAQVSFSPLEVELIESMSSVLGTNPRSLKRFVNIYRILKAHDDFPVRIAEKNILSVLLLLALPIGEFRPLSLPFQQFVEDYRAQYIASVEPFDSRSDNYSFKAFLEDEEKKIPSEAHDDRDQLLKLLSLEKHKLLEVRLNTVTLHYNMTQRFQFGE